MKGFNRRQFLGAGLGAAALFGLPGRLLAASDPKRTLRVGYVGSTTVPTGPSGWALHQGITQKHLEPLGFDNISTYVFVNGPELNEALLSGALDVGTYGDTPAMVCYAMSQASRLLSIDAVGMNAWLVTPKNGVSSVAELKGKVVATPLGSYMHRYLIGTLHEAGILKDTKIVALPARDSEAALARGDIAAYAAQSELGPTLLSNGYPLIDQATDHPHLRGCTVTVASEKLLKQVPHFSEAWLAARRESVAQITADWPAYFSFHAQASKYSQAAIEATYTGNEFQLEPLSPVGLELLRGAKQFLLEQRLIRRDFDINEWKV